MYCCITVSWWVFKHLYVRGEKPVVEWFEFAECQAIYKLLTPVTGHKWPIPDLLGMFQKISLQTDEQGLSTFSCKA